MGIFSSYNSVEPLPVQSDINTESFEIPSLSKLDKLTELIYSPTRKKDTTTTVESTTSKSPDLNYFSNTTVIKSNPTTISNTTNTSNHINYKSISLDDMLKKTGLDKIVKITSGFRDHNVGKAGNKSNHRKKNEYGLSMAYDITPITGTFKDMYLQIANNQEMQNWLKGNGFNINDETTKEALAQTGGTGAHFHIGPDKFRVYKAQEGGVFSSYKSVTPVYVNTEDILEITPFTSKFDTLLELLPKYKKSTTITTTKSNTPSQDYFSNIELIKPKTTEVVLEISSTKEPYKYNSRQSWTKDIKTALLNSLAKIGKEEYLNDILAMDALESGWGNSQSGKNNFGGIKGEGTTSQTSEYINGKKQNIKSSFKDFDSLQDFTDYQVQLLKDKNAFNGDFLNNISKWYATDPNYKTKIQSIKNNLS